ncbi:hypothetical protein NM208_g4268 [Fusarium decemcellulare]|uniref:Uncharacterized protein n=1 Tax=Fusarium decemcellulare TaxID=57161 RepID=A0ACC1SLD2_9HYPO|nr:hypothetical protein NM208_g4268 [Fusarium decemcellulare]
MPDQTADEAVVPTPEPRGLPFIGNVSEFDPAHPLQILQREIFHLSFPGGKTVVFVTTRSLINAVSDGSRFQKTPDLILGQVLAVVHDDIFTAKSDDPYWGVPYRILIPAFGPVSIRGMFDDMRDIVTQMAMKWARHGSSNPIPVSSDFTHLTLDTLALCSMNFRFNSFYHEDLHPFINAIANVLTEITIEHLSKLPYSSTASLRGPHVSDASDILKVLRETLRLCSPIPAFSVESKEDGTLLAGKYSVKKGRPIVSLLIKSHLDPRVNHMRASISRPFPWQEALLSAAMLLHNFNFQMADPSYQLDISETITIKSKRFYMYASLRHGMNPGALEWHLAGGSSPRAETGLAPERANSNQTNGGENHTDLSIFYGSNSGTYEVLARRLAGKATFHGYAVSNLSPLNTTREKLLPRRLFVWITSSYEGQPPDNAARFCAWVENLKGAEMRHVEFAVFDCGHYDWAQTCHRIPRLLDYTLAARGATRIVPMGLTDVAESDIFNDFEAWEEDLFWPALQQKYQTHIDTDSKGQSGLSVEVSMSRSSYLRQDVREARVIEIKTLTSPMAPRKNHIEIQLPTSMTYRTGDYLAILPLNPPQNVERVCPRLFLAWDAQFMISGDDKMSLPIGQHVSAYEIFRSYVELGQPATRRDLRVLAQSATDENQFSALDILEEFASIQLSVGALLALLPPMHIRQSSISSSSLQNPTSVALTYSILHEPSFSGKGRHVGVATQYLDSLKPGERLHVAVRSSHEAFHLPHDVVNTPVICFCAGSGLAPFRGFFQDRAAILSAGRRLAPALLFYGCRSPDADDLYRKEFDAWEKLGAVSVRRAFSRDTAKNKGCAYDQDRLLADKEDVYELWHQGAKFDSVGWDEAKIKQWLETVRNVRLELLRPRGHEKISTAQSNTGIQNNPDSFLRGAFSSLVENDSPSTPTTHRSTPPQPLVESDPGDCNAWILNAELMHHYSTVGYRTLSFCTDVIPLLQSDIPRTALSQYFLLHEILAFSAFHMAYLNPDDSYRYLQQASHHENLAISGMRHTLASPITSENCHALYATSIFLIINSFAASDYCQNPRTSQPPVQAVVDIFALANGMGTILWSSEQDIRTGPLKALFGQFECKETNDCNLISLVNQLLQLREVVSREPNLDEKRRLLLASSIDCFGRCLFTVRQNKTLAAPAELRAAFLYPILLPEGFMHLARRNHPWALVMLAYYGVLLHWAEEKCWFLRSFAHSLMDTIASSLIGSQWAYLLEWPIRITGSAFILSMGLNLKHQGCLKTQIELAPFQDAIREDGRFDGHGIFGNGFAITLNFTLFPANISPLDSGTGLFIVVFAASVVEMAARTV